MRTVETFETSHESTKTSGGAEQGANLSTPNVNWFSGLFYHLKTQSIAAATLAMTVLPAFKAATFFGLTVAAVGITLVTSCKTEEPEPPKPPEPPPPPVEPPVGAKLDTVYHKITTVAYLNENVATMERQATSEADSLKRLDITLGTLAISDGQFEAFGDSLNRLRGIARSERVIRFDSTAFAISPAAAGILITYADWENLGFVRISVGAGGIKFDILSNEASKFAAKGVGPELVNIRLAAVAEVEILGPNDFEEKVKKIEEFFAAGYDSVKVTVRSNIPCTNSVMNILNKKTITGGNVSWTGVGALVPSKDRQEIDGRLFAYLPVGQDGDMRFYIPGKNNAHLITDWRGIADTDTISTSRFFVGDQAAVGLRAQQAIYVNTGRKGTMEGAVDARNFSGYDRTNDPKKHTRVIVQDGKQLTLENANVDVLSRFQTDAIQGAYNYGYTGSENYIWSPYPIKWMNMDFGPNGPLQLLFPNNPLSNPNIAWTPSFDQLYDDLVIKSMHIGRNDVIYEAGHFVNGKDVSNSALNILEKSYLITGKAPTYTIEGSKIDIRWTQLQACQMFQGNGKVLYFYLGYLEWLSQYLFELKKHNLTFKVGNDVMIVSPRDAPLIDYRINDGKPSWGVSPDASKHMLYDYNIVLDHKPEPQVVLLDVLFGNISAGLAPAHMRLTGGWGQEWWNILQR